MKKLLMLLLSAGLAFGEGTETLKLGTMTHDVQSPLTINWTGTTQDFTGATITGLASNFLSLTDVPHSYTGQTLKIVRVNAGETGLEFVTSGGGGTVTSVSVTGANGIGVSGSPITTSGTIALSLGVISPTSVNGLTFTANAVGFSIAGGTTSKTLTIDNGLEFAGTDGTTLNIGSGGTLGSNAFTSTAYVPTSRTLTIAGSALDLSADRVWTQDTITGLSTTGLVKRTAANTLGTITDSSSNWDTAYTDRLKWDGGSTGLTAATGRTSLGATTTGSNIFTVTDPSAITFLKVNADNSVTLENAATFRSDIGAGTGGGTVTNFSSGNLSPLFTTSVGTATTTPALSFTLSNAGARTVLSNNTGSSAAPDYVSNPAFDKIANLTTNGFVKTGSSDGTLSIDTNTYLTGNQTVTLSGDVSGSGATSITTTLGNIPTATTMAGYLAATAIAAPSTPAAGIGRIYVDSTSKNLSVKDDAGVVKHGVQTKAAVTSNFITAINDAGSVSAAQPTATDVGLGNVTNDAQTKAAVVPNTAPSAGQILVGNAGGTAYAPATLSGSGATATLSSGGVLTLSAIANGTLSNSAITIAGTSTALGGSITLDTISGVSSNGFLKRTGTNTWTNDSSTYITGNQTITLSGDTTGSGTTSITTALANIPTAVPAAGSIVFADIAAPSSPSAAHLAIFGDSTDLRFHDKNAAGTIGTTVVADTGASNNFLTAISAAGVISKAQPTATNVGLGNVTNDAQIKSSDFPSSSVDSEVVLFSSTTGKVVKRASSTGIAKVASGVLSAVTAPSGTIVGDTDTQTLTNKNITWRVVSMSDATSITPTADTADINTQANTQAAGTLTVNAPSGSPVNGQALIIRIKSTNVQTFSWNATYRAGADLALPTTSTGSSKTDYLKFIYDSDGSGTWDYVASVSGF